MHLPGNVRTFLTHSGGRPRTCGVLVDRRGGSAPLSKPGLRTLAGLAGGLPGACAFGKIVLLRDGGIFTYQAQLDRDPVRSFCGNSTAAALLILGEGGGIRATVHGAGRRVYEVRAEVTDDEVAQHWIVPAEAVQLRRWRGSRVLFLTTLNSYAIFLDPLPAEMSAAAALRALRASALATKLAVIGGDSDAPLVEFHNANGRHGAAPQTGVATLALACRGSPWLRDRLPGGRFIHATAQGPRVTKLPAIAETACGRLAFEMPRVSVAFDAAPVEAAA